MSLSLVAYSDDEDSSEEESPLPPKINPTNKFASSLTDLVIKKDSKGGIKITVPSVTDFEDVNEEEEEERQRKRRKLLQSSSGSSLLSVLPQPQTKKVKATTLSFTPQSVKNAALKPHTSPKVKSVTKECSGDAEDDANINTFFPFTSSEQSDSTEHPQIDESWSLPALTTTVNLAPHMEDVSAPDPGNSCAKPVPSSSSNSVDINDPSYKAFIAQKFGEEPPEAINIVDVNVSHHLSQNREYIKTISEEKPEEFKGLEPSAVARRKHQITYLAYQAKQRELQLKNEWATNKLTKSQTRMKYGF